MAATILLFARGMTVIRTAISSIVSDHSELPEGDGPGNRGTRRHEAAGEAVTRLLSRRLGSGSSVLLPSSQRSSCSTGTSTSSAPTWSWLKRAQGRVRRLKSAAKSVASWFSRRLDPGLLYWIRWPFVWLARHAGGPDLQLDHPRRQGRHQLAHEALRTRRQLRDHRRLDHGAVQAGARADQVHFRRHQDHHRGRAGPDRRPLRSLRRPDGRLLGQFLDVGRGAISSLLGIIGDLMGALGHIPELGKPFKRAANDIHDAQHRIDDLRDSTKKHRQEQKRSDDTSSRTRCRTLVKLHDRYKTPPTASTTSRRAPRPSATRQRRARSQQALQRRAEGHRRQGRWRAPAGRQAAREHPRPRWRLSRHRRRRRSQPQRRPEPGRRSDDPPEHARLPPQRHRRDDQVTQGTPPPAAPSAARGAAQAHVGRRHAQPLRRRGGRPRPALAQRRAGGRAVGHRGDRQPAADGRHQPGAELHPEHDRHAVGVAQRPLGLGHAPLPGWRRPAARDPQPLQPARPHVRPDHDVDHRRRSRAQLLHYRGPGGRHLRQPAGHGASHALHQVVGDLAQAA
jgi:hypothetical protein